MNNKMRRGFAAMLVAGAMGLVAAPLAAQATTVNMTVDCAGSPFAELSRYVAAADTVTYNVTNCTDVGVSDNNWQNEVITTLTGSTFVGTAGHNYEFYDDSDRPNTWWDSSLLSALAEHVPSGSLLLTKDLTIGTSPSQMDVGADNTGGSHGHGLGNNADCHVQVDLGQGHVYESVTVAVSKAGEYTFRGVSTDPISNYLNSDNSYAPMRDPMLALYKGFDPAHPDANVVGCNDDINDLFGYDNNDLAEELSSGQLMEGHLPFFKANLKPGTYTLLLLTWDSMSASQWAAGDNGNFTFTPGAETATIQMWGPSGGLKEGSYKDVLANTGSVVDSTWAMVAALMLLAGAGVLATRRTKKN
ncbi:MAG: hypothetical protein RL556_807 [Actinomycetota bacterium]|jgi:LPXTG-motif cell wall-anchored protein